MSTIPDEPTLTPQFCFNQTALRDFLRVSRSIDDTIGQNLNALVTPGDTPFDASSTAVRQPRPIGRRAIDPKACDMFKSRVLFPSWQARDRVLQYCAGVSEDPNDPTKLLRAAEDEMARKRVVNERLDPYSGRYFPKDTRGEALASLLRNENMVEDIIRQRTWQSIGERCENETDDFDRALQDWQSKR